MNKILLAAGFVAATASANSDEPPVEIPTEAELQFSDDLYADQDKLEMIKSGLANLAGIRYETTSFSSGGSGYSGVYGDFCVFDAQLNSHDDPSLYPTIEDMIMTSDHCADYTFTLPLDEVVSAVSSHDSSVGQANLPVSGMLFHMGYAGAGIMANVLATFENALVVPEHPAIHDALFACDFIHSKFESADCSSSLQKQLVEDVITLATRSSDPSKTHAYIKFHADSTAYISMVREIVSEAPWTFHHRDSETVLAKSTQRNLDTCNLTRRNPSFLLAQKSSEYGIDLDGMSQEELCALYLSTLLEVATEEHVNSGTGKIVEYDQLLEAGFIETVLLPYFGIDADSAAISAAVEDTLTKKSNTYGVPGNNVVQWDPESDVVDVSDEVRAASKLFMGAAAEAVGRL